jgi:ERCC4-type nuclease
MIILVDSREQAPYDFAKYRAATVTATLPVGDNSLPGFEDRVSIERKSLDDLIGCLMGADRVRFEKELARGRACDFFCVVIEGSLSEVSQGKFRSAMRPHSALQSLITFQVRYRVSFVWAGSRKAAEYFTYWILAKYLREIEERFKTATKAQEKAA